jgi:drug/metabolite transporter (DMT)-like permease
LLLSFLILGEHVAMQQWIGGILVISGMILIGRDENKITIMMVFYLRKDW